LVFAADLNRTSVKKMNKKNINKTNESIVKNSSKNIRNKSIDEFIYMGEIMNSEKLQTIKNNDDLEGSLKTTAIKIKKNKIISPKIKK
jgi:predicted membrane protein